MKKIFNIPDYKGISPLAPKTAQPAVKPSVLLSNKPNKSSHKESH